MPRYASGKYAVGISDRSGRSYPLHEMVLEWNGLLVGRDEFEAKQPQLDPKHHRAVITVNEPGHGRSTGDTVRFRDVEDFDGFTSSVVENSSGYSITKVTDDTFTFTVSGETATVGDVNGGGGFASAGPVTVSA